MRIVHIVNTFSNLSETFLYDLINSQYRSGIECHICTFRKTNMDVRPYPDQYIHKIKRSDWNPARYLNYLRACISIRPKQTANWNIYRSRLRRTLSRIDPQVIHAHFGDMGVLIEPVARELNIPLVVTFHGYDISILPETNFWAEKYKELFKTASAIIGVSNYICQKLEHRGADSKKTFMIHNGIDINKFCPESDAGSEEGKFTFTFIGRFVDKKAPVMLLKSYRYLLQKYNITDVELQMIGNGPLLSRSKEFVKANDMERFVRFLGFVDHKKIPAFLHSSDVYVQHSMRAGSGDEEGMGVTLAEASASAVPVIATRHNGFPDVIIDKETGYLVEEGDFEAMGEKMYRLYEDKPLRLQMGREGRKHIENSFEKLKQTDKVVSLYKKVLQSFPENK